MTQGTNRALRVGPLFVLAAVLVFARVASAAPIATWDLANATGQDAIVLSTALNASATGINEVGVTEWSSTAQDGFIAASGWESSNVAYDPAKYYEFTVTAAAGFEIDYQTFDLALFRGVWGGGHGAQLWDLHASLDGFVGSDLALDSLDISASAADEQTQLTANISGLGSQQGTVTFRLYGYDQTVAGDYSGLGNDSGWLITGTGLDPVVGGSVNAISEPSRGLLMVLGLLGLVVVGSPRK